MPLRSRFFPVLLLTLAGLLLAPFARAAQADAEVARPVARAAMANLADAAAEVDLASFEAFDLDWLDSTRHRAVPVRLYWPVRASSDAKLPLVVFSHGIGGSRRGYSYLGAYWASQGYASLHLQHVGSDRELWFGNPLSLLGRLQGAAQDREAIDRVKDLRFALDQLLAGERGARIDNRRIVAAGHSYGANTTMLAAGARVTRSGQLVDLQDPRIAAAVLISAPPFYGQADTAAILQTLRVPSLHITATEDVIRIPGYYSGSNDRVAVFDAVGSTRKVLAMFDGGSHSMFTDRAGSGGAALNPQVKSATRQLALAFFRSVFDGSDVALHDWPRRFAPIVSRFVNQPAAGL